MDPHCTPFFLLFLLHRICGLYKKLVIVSKLFPEFCVPHSSKLGVPNLKLVRSIEKLGAYN